MILFSLTLLKYMILRLYKFELHYNKLNLNEYTNFFLEGIKFSKTQRYEPKY